MGKGLVGVVTKPIGGAAELVSQTGEYKQFTEVKMNSRILIRAIFIPLYVCMCT